MRERIKNILQLNKTSSPGKKINSYLNSGRVPWSEGYSEFKYKSIKDIIYSDEHLAPFIQKKLPLNFGIGIDERVVEYPWIFSKINKGKNLLLDAGSTFNFDFIVNHPTIKNKELTIYTFFPEDDCFFKNRISYVFGDLRDMYFKEATFDEIVSQSTIEHIGMDNSIYGYEEKNIAFEKSYDYLMAVKEMERILKPGGRLLITFPFGKHEHHGFFQQFDGEMLQKILDLLSDKGHIDTDFFKYESNGWRFASKPELAQVVSYNPHTGKGKLDDGAAHCRSIACIEFIKNAQ